MRLETTERAAFRPFSRMRPKPCMGRARLIPHRRAARVVRHDGHAATGSLYGLASRPCVSPFQERVGSNGAEGERRRGLVALRSTACSHVPMLISAASVAMANALVLNPRAGRHAGGGGMLERIREGRGGNGAPTQKQRQALRRQMSLPRRTWDRRTVHA